MPTVDEIYAAAAKTTGKPEPELRAMASGVFASMLLHAMQCPVGKPCWTLMTIEPFSVEVDVPRRERLRREWAE